MPGFMFVFGQCYTCRRELWFNPVWVPSIPATLTSTGEKEPVCAGCIARANPERVKNGLAPIEIHPDAYQPEPC